MALSINNDEADRLARELARMTGESMTEAVIRALRERLAREQARARSRFLEDRVQEIVDRVSRLPVLEDGTPDEIIGYDEHGLPRSDSRG